MRHSYNVEAGADLHLIPKPYYLATGSGGGRGTNHGTPYEYDSHIPLIFVSPGMKPKVVERSVRTVDLAPTLADLLGIAFPAGLDGRPLEEIKSKN